MARSPKLLYPLQVDTSDPGYPAGKARNRPVPADPSGSPFEKDWVNDVWGLLQATLAEAGISIDETPEKVGDSQFVDALHAIITSDTEPALTTLSTRADGAEDRLDDLEGRMVSQEHLSDYGIFAIVDGTHSAGNHYGLAKVFDFNGNFSVIGSNQAKVPRPGTYEVTVSGHFKSSSTDPDTPITINVERGPGVAPVGGSSGGSFACIAQRAGSSPAEVANLNRTSYVTITNTTTQTILVASGFSSSTSQDSMLIIKRIG